MIYLFIILAIINIIFDIIVIKYIKDEIYIIKKALMMLAKEQDK